MKSAEALKCYPAPQTFCQEKPPCDQLAINFKDKFRARDEIAYHWQNSVYCDSSIHVLYSQKSSWKIVN